MGQNDGMAQAAVSLAQDEAIAIVPGRILRVDAENLEVEEGEHVGHAERAADMPAAGPTGHVDHLLTQLDGLLPQGDRFLVGQWHGMFPLVSSDFKASSTMSHVCWMSSSV